MSSKEWMFTDAEFLPIGYNVLLRFYCKLRGEKEQHFVDNPDPKWLLDFVSKDKPYELHYGHPWQKAFEFAIAKESRETIVLELQKNGMLTDDDICTIIENVISKYDPRLSRNMLIDSEKYLKFIDIPAQKVWKYTEEK